MKTEHTAIDLFCGAGGLSEGFRQAGFRVLAGNDFNETAGETYAATHLDAKFLPGPIQDVTASRLLQASGLSKGELDCLIGGPPCQAFSVYNHQRGMHDDRSQLFREYLRLVAGLSPKWIVMENVTGILSVGAGEAVDAIKSGLLGLGYSVEMKVLKAEEYGVPQERRRVVFLGTRTGLPILWPEPTHGKDKPPFVTIRDAIGDLPALKNGEAKGSVAYSKAPGCDYQREMRTRSSLVHNHSAPKLSGINLQRMKHIPPGGSWRDIPLDLLPEGMKEGKALRSHETLRTHEMGRPVLYGPYEMRRTLGSLHSSIARSGNQCPRGRAASVVSGLVPIRGFDDGSVCADRQCRAACSGTLRCPFASRFHGRRGRCPWAANVCPPPRDVFRPCGYLKYLEKMLMMFRQRPSRIGSPDCARFETPDAQNPVRVIRSEFALSQMASALQHFVL